MKSKVIEVTILIVVLCALIYTSSKGIDENVTTIPLNRFLHLNMVDLDWEVDNMAGTSLERTFKLEGRKLAVRVLINAKLTPKKLNQKFETQNCNENSSLLKNVDGCEVISLENENKQSTYIIHLKKMVGGLVQNITLKIESNKKNKDKPEVLISHIIDSISIVAI
ncbi:hypothetical protein N9N67_08080 [Bacteriovoracaceae bacterium]|nr:hypothetical protein [Bacteriovoracaceae bacterium]